MVDPRPGFRRQTRSNDIPLPLIFYSFGESLKNQEGHPLFRIAAVSFLNTVPLIDWLETRGKGRVNLIRDLPSRLLASLQDGTADVALLPVAEILRVDTGGILPVAGIACRGPVDSVKVFTTGGLGDIRRISADRGSRTSVALLRVLLAERYGLHPEISEFIPQTGILPGVDEGILIIGDACFEYERFLRESGHDDVRGWDLGELWWDLTGLPFVFAIWAVALEFPGRVGSEGVTELKELLTESLGWGLENRSDIAAREAAAGRLGHRGDATAEAIDYYFRKSLRYTVGDEELEGIRQFRRLAAKHGVIPKGSLPPIL